MREIIGIILFLILIGGTILIFQEQLHVFEREGRETPILPRVGGVDRTPTPTRVRTPVDNSRPGREVTPEVTPPLNNLHTSTSNDEVRDLRFVSAIESRYDKSPYAGYITFLERDTSIRKSDPNEEYVVLLVSRALQSPVNITGWRLFDYTNRVSYKIPSGVDIVDPGRVYGLGNIVVGGGDRIIVVSGRSPIGDSFRVNKCLGYRQQFKDFSPSIKEVCEDPENILLANQDVPFTDDKCFDVVEDLDECEAVVDIPSGVSRACKSFLRDELTEEGCVKRDRNNPDFLLPEWRIFLDSRKELWEDKKRNAIYLIDNNNKLVAVFTY